jgi:hypothetical protein
LFQCAGIVQKIPLAHTSPVCHRVGEQQKTFRLPHTYTMRPKNIIPFTQQWWVHCQRRKLEYCTALCSQTSIKLTFFISLRFSMNRFIIWYNIEKV